MYEIGSLSLSHFWKLLKLIPLSDRVCCIKTKYVKFKSYFHEIHTFLLISKYTRFFHLSPFSDSEVGNLIEVLITTNNVIRKGS